MKINRKSLHTTSDRVDILTDGGTPTIDTVEEFMNSTDSSGFFDGGILSDAGSGNINISEGSGMIRTTTTETDPLLSFKFGPFTNISVATDTTKYVYVDYNNGSAIQVLSDSEFEETTTKILIGVATSEAGSIESVFNLGVRLQESIGQAGRFIRRVFGISRDERRGGLIFGETGTRNITMSAGHLWWGRTDYTITERTGGENFDLYYRDSPSGWNKNTVTQYPNTQYDDGDGTLANLLTNKWGTLWIYLEPDNHIIMVYGREQHNTESEAEEEPEPNTLPPRLQNTAVLSARIVFLKDAATGTFTSAFATIFNTVGVTNHNELAGLQGGISGEHFHLTSAEYGSGLAGQFVPYTGATGALDMGGNSILDVGLITDDFDNMAIDIPNRALIDQYEDLTIDWGEHVLYPESGGSAILNFKTGGLADFLDSDITTTAVGSFGQVDTTSVYFGSTPGDFILQTANNQTGISTGSNDFLFGYDFSAGGFVIENATNAVEYSFNNTQADFNGNNIVGVGSISTATLDASATIIGNQITARWEVEDQIGTINAEGAEISIGRAAVDQTLFLTFLGLTNDGGLSFDSTGSGSFALTHPLTVNGVLTIPNTIIFSDVVDSSFGLITGGYEFSYNDGLANLSGIQDINMFGTIDLGNNTITDGTMTGPWNMSSGILTNVNIDSGNINVTSMQAGNIAISGNTIDDAIANMILSVGGTQQIELAYVNIDFKDNDFINVGNIESTGAFYNGDQDTDGSWRTIRSGNNLHHERRESGAWVVKEAITP